MQGESGYRNGNPCRDVQGDNGIQPKVKRVLPYLHDVPHFLGILIHPGVDEKSSSGCIIVGKNKLKGKVFDSRAISDALNAILLKEKDIWITIE